MSDAFKECPLFIREGFESDETDLNLSILDNIVEIVPDIQRVVLFIWFTRKMEGIFSFA